VLLLADEAAAGAHYTTMIQTGQASPWGAYQIGDMPLCLIKRGFGQYGQTTPLAAF